jgi:hypothetical protein
VTDFTVVFVYGASSAVTISAPADATPDEIIDLAAQKDEAHLCHECSRHLTLGDPEPNLVEDSDGETIWQTEDETRATPQADVAGELQQIRETLAEGHIGPETAEHLGKWLARLIDQLHSEAS